MATILLVVQTTAVASLAVTLAATLAENIAENKISKNGSLVCRGAVVLFKKI